MIPRKQPHHADVFDLLLPQIRAGIVYNILSRLRCPENPTPTIRIAGLWLSLFAHAESGVHVAVKSDSDPPGREADGCIRPDGLFTRTVTPMLPTRRS